MDYDIVSLHVCCTLDQFELLVEDYSVENFKLRA